MSQNSTEFGPYRRRWNARIALIPERSIAVSLSTPSRSLGARRISVGGALPLAAWTGFNRAARMLKSEGSFAGLAGLVPYAEINGLFANNLLAHQPQGR
jgi:hypothetical protein